jgi:hypothetical protein
MKIKIILSKSSRPLDFDFLWKNLIKELQLYDVGEPYWFCTDSLSLIIKWLDEVFAIDKQQSKIVRVRLFFIISYYKDHKYLANRSWNTFISSTTFY